MTTQVFTTLDAKDFTSLLAETIREAVKAEFDRIGGLPQEPQKQFLTRKEASEILGVSTVTLNAWSNSGVVPCLTVGTRIRYRLADIENALKVKRGRAA